MANVQATALKLIPTMHPIDGYPIAYTPKWCVADGGVEQGVLCDHVFDVGVNDLADVSLHSATCASGAFFLHRTMSIDPDTYDYFDPICTLFYAAKGEVVVTEVCSYQYSGVISGPDDEFFAVTEDGTQVTYIDYSTRDKICFTKSGAVWSANRFVFPSMPTANTTPYGWIDASGDNLFLLAGSNDGGAEFVTTPMSAAGDMTIVPLSISGVEGVPYIYMFEDNFFATPFNSQSRGVFFTSDGDSVGLHFAAFNTTSMVANLLHPGTRSLYSRGQGQIVYRPGADVMTTLAWNTNTTYPPTLTGYGPGELGVLPTGYMDAPLPEAIDGRYDYGTIANTQHVNIRGDVPAALKVCRYSDGITPNTWDIWVDGFAQAKFAENYSTQERFIAFWVGASAPLPQLNPEFFTAFTKSYEVRGYKA